MTVSTENKSLTPREICLVLHSWIQNYFNLSSEALIINELGFYNKDKVSTVDHAFRADVALASDRLVGFEIKSEKDSLKRWSSQMVAYPNVFDETWLCVHRKHLDAAMKLTPEHIGILQLDDFGCLTIIRTAETDGFNNIYDLSGLLWKDELIELAKAYLIPVKAQMRKREIKHMLSDHLALRQVADFAIERLKVRKSVETSVEGCHS